MTPDAGAGLQDFDVRVGGVARRITSHTSRPLRSAIHRQLVGDGNVGSQLRSDYSSLSTSYRAAHSPPRTETRRCPERPFSSA